MPDITEVTPWPGAKEGPFAVLPRGVRFVCAFSSHLGIDRFDEALFLHTEGAHVELWSVSTIRDSIGALILEVLNLGRCPSDGLLGWGRVGVCSAGGADEEATVVLLEALVRARAGFAVPIEFLRSGIICRSAYEALIGGIERERKRKAARAEQARSPIVQAAEQLGLRPTPTGETETDWSAACPGTCHRLHLDVAEDRFFCGYCRRRGGVEKLESFVRRRRGKRRDELTGGTRGA